MISRRTFLTSLSLAAGAAAAEIRPAGGMIRGGRVNYGGTFSPESITGLKLWLKADALALNDNDAVGSWTDASGLGNHATQGTAAKKPTFKTAILNGKAVVRFDGIDDVLATASIATFPSKRGSIFVVSKLTAAGGEDTILSTYNGTDPDWQWGYSVTAGIRPIFYWDGATTDNIEADAAPDTAAWHLLNLIRSGDTTMGFYRDGAAQTGRTIADNQPAANPLSIGALTAGTEVLNGDIAEVIIYDVALSAEQRDSVEAYIAAKYGLTIA